jgi:uncharacterized peroxidase-related enzyme
MSYLHQAPPDQQTASTFEAIRSAIGFVPNFFRAQTMRPDLVHAEVNLMSAILDNEGALTRQQKEYLFLVCSAANMSTYCVTAHCEIVRMLGIEGPEPEQIAIDYTSTDLPLTLKALLAFATKLTHQPTKIARQDIDDLRTFGFSDQEIMETVVVVGFAKFSNFVAFGLGTVPDFDSTKALPGQSESLHADSLL